jgi:hypothetical protein
MKQTWNSLDSLGSISNFKIIKTEAWRIVEDQSRSSTRKMVDTTTEHEILEQMIENTKPNLKFYGDESAFGGLHYLLYTPFRYPPLRTGSRFGKQTERNIFYSSLELETAMCEKAFHRLNFLLASKGDIGGKTVNCTAFKVNIDTNKGIDLSKIPFVNLREKISSPILYNHSQELGSCMRVDGVHAFISYSARSKDNGKNLNIFTPIAFDKNQSIEKSFQFYSCYSTKSSVEFYSNSIQTKKPIVFNMNTFYVDGQFPSI